MKRLIRLSDDEMSEYLVDPTRSQASLLRDEACWRFLALSEGVATTFPDDLAFWIASKILDWGNVPTEYLNFLSGSWPNSLTDADIDSLVPPVSQADRIKLMREFAYRLQMGRSLTPTAFAWLAHEIEDLPLREKKELMATNQVIRFQRALAYFNLMEERRGRRRRGSHSEGSAAEIAQIFGVSPGTVNGAYKEYRRTIRWLVHNRVEIPTGIPSESESKTLLQIDHELSRQLVLESRSSGFKYLK